MNRLHSIYTDVSNLVSTAEIAIDALKDPDHYNIPCLVDMLRDAIGKVVDAEAQQTAPKK
jgi:catabolite regulation protein CreA